MCRALKDEDKKLVVTLPHHLPTAQIHTSPHRWPLFVLEAVFLLGSLIFLAGPLGEGHSQHTSTVSGHQAIPAGWVCCYQGSLATAPMSSCVFPELWFCCLCSHLFEILRGPKLEAVWG